MLRATLILCLLLVFKINVNISIKILNWHYYGYFRWNFGCFMFSCFLSFFRYFFLNFCKQLFLLQGISSRINFLQSSLVRNVLNGHYSIFLHPGFYSTALQEPYPTWQKRRSLHVDFIFTLGKKSNIDGKVSLVRYWNPVCLKTVYQTT